MRKTLFILASCLCSFNVYLQVNYCDYFKLGVEKTETSPSMWIEHKNEVKDSFSVFLNYYHNRFDYVLYNRLNFSELSKLSPNTAQIETAFCEELNAPTAINSYFNVLVNKNTEKIVFSQEELFKVASRFFMCDKINESNLKIGYHICVGINGQKEFNSERDYTLLEAFSFESIFYYLTIKDGSRLIKNFESYISKSSKKHKKANLSPNELLEKVKQDCYHYMENDSDLKSGLLKYYKEIKNNIGIAII